MHTTHTMQFVTSNQYHYAPHQMAAQVASAASVAAPAATGHEHLMQQQQEQLQQQQQALRYNLHHSQHHLQQQQQDLMQQTAAASLHHQQHPFHSVAAQLPLGAPPLQPQHLHHQHHQQQQQQQQQQALSHSLHHSHHLQQDLIGHQTAGAQSGSGGADQFSPTAAAVTAASSLHYLSGQQPVTSNGSAGSGGGSGNAVQRRPTPASSASDSTPPLPQHPFHGAQLPLHPPPQHLHQQPQQQPPQCYQPLPVQTSPLDQLGHATVASVSASQFHQHQLNQHQQQQMQQQQQHSNQLHHQHHHHHNQQHHHNHNHHHHSHHQQQPHHLHNQLGHQHAHLPLAPMPQPPGQQHQHLHQLGAGANQQLGGGANSTPADEKSAIEMGGEHVIGRYEAELVAAVGRQSVTETSGGLELSAGRHESGAEPAVAAVGRRANLASETSGGELDELDDDELDDDDEAGGDARDETASQSDNELKANRMPEFDWMRRGQSSSVNAAYTVDQKRQRTAYTRFQILQLEQEFHTSRYLSRRRRIEIAHNLKLSERQIKIWFQNRRMKYKKDNNLPNTKNVKKKNQPQSQPHSVGAGPSGAAQTANAAANQHLKLEQCNASSAANQQANLGLHCKMEPLCKLEPSE